MRILEACLFYSTLVNLAHPLGCFSSRVKRSPKLLHEGDGFHRGTEARGITSLQRVLLSATPRSSSTFATLPSRPLLARAQTALKGIVGDKSMQPSRVGNRKRDILRDMSTDEHTQFFQSLGEAIDALDDPSSELERFDAFVQNMMDSRDEDPWRVTDEGQSVLSQYYYPDLSAKPTWCHAEGENAFTWLRKLEMHAPVIAEELRVVCDAELPTGYESCDDHECASLEDVVGLRATEKAIYVPGFDEHPGNGYFQLVLKINDNATKLSELFPQTMAAIEACGVRTGVRLIAFGKQLPQTALHWHSDGRNFMLTAHLPLSGPSKISDERAPAFGKNSQAFPGVDIRKSASGMVMAPLSLARGRDAIHDLAVPRSWEPPSVNGRGSGVVFDTTFFHSAYNDGDVPADILFIDFFHPELSDKEVEAIKCLQQSLRLEDERRASQHVS